ncbi:hypothetical protein AMTRI_Chr12g233610 [Amborella trichopoda]
MIAGKHTDTLFSSSFSFVMEGLAVVTGPISILWSITILQLSDNISHDKADRIGAQFANVVWAKQFMEGLDESRMLFAVVPMEKQLDSLVPPQLEPLTRDYSDVIPDELPKGLPPMRDIQLISRSSLQYKVVYRINPKKHEELQRQVIKLL